MEPSKSHVFVLYKGDKFIDLGTYKQLSIKHHMSMGRLYDIKAKTPKQLKKPGDALLLISCD